MARTIDLLRVAQDQQYAATLSTQDWYDLAQTSEFRQVLAEHRELLESALLQNAAVVPGFLQVTPPAQPAPQAQPPSGPFGVIGQKVPRMQGLGVVTGLGQYTEHMSALGTLYTRTLRSPHPHARVKAVDTSKAEQLTGVHAVLHRGKLPPEYADVNLGAGPPDRGLFDEEAFAV